MYTERFAVGIFCRARTWFHVSEPHVKVASGRRGDGTQSVDRGQTRLLRPRPLRLPTDCTEHS